MTPAVTASTTDVRRAVEAVFRQEWSRIIGALVRVTHSLEIAEDAVQEAFAIVVQAWPSTGIPEPARSLDHDDGAAAGRSIVCAARRSRNALRSARRHSRPSKRSTAEPDDALDPCPTTSCASSSSAATPRWRSRRKSR